MAQEVLADTAGPGDEEYRGSDVNTKTALELLNETQLQKEQLDKVCEDKDREVSEWLEGGGIFIDETATEPSSSGSNGSSSVASVPTDVQLRQRMFSNMEQQYEVARAATHTMRGVGLGFGSQPRSY